MKSIEFSYGSMVVQNFVSLFNEGRLNLEPGFQRQSVWTLNDRKKLIQSISQNYPIPSVFLYKSTDGSGKLKYDVLDGKQRLESILMFQGVGKFKRNKFSARLQLDERNGLQDWSWKEIQRAGLEFRVAGYNIQTVEVSGELAEIIDLFVRINSTGKRLTGQEKRHAKYFSSPFLKRAGRLGEIHAHFFLDNKVVSRGQFGRMKHVELICELMASIHSQGLINKKTALDNIIGGQTVEGKSLVKASKQFVRTLNIIKKMFPELRSTRFANSAEFYSLFMLIWEMDQDKFILNNSRKNKQAQILLKWLSNGVDLVRSKISKAEGAQPDEQIFANYLFTTRGDSDSAATRNRRADILRQILGGLFEKKDEKRGFTLEQRRLLWNSDESKKCPNCKKTLSWENFTIDHIKPYSLGGRSSLSNAKLMCRSCNSKLGTKRKRRKKYR
ncbi:MAG: hypothetical protein CNIPEHKO_02735 [Anaerolineales bacterium]|nr:hypothetical protein [Anaerolineales bacterium]